MSLHSLFFLPSSPALPALFFLPSTPALPTFLPDLTQPPHTAIILYDDGQRPAVEALVDRMVHRALELEGTATGEHGVGMVKRDHLVHELGQEAVDAMRRVSFLPFCLSAIGRRLG